MNKHLILALLVVFFYSGFGQVPQVENKFEAYFNEAYRKYPRIPKGVLEAVAYTNTRIRHIVPERRNLSCQGLPAYHGVMGLVEDGKGYFEENLKTVARYAGYREEEIKRDPRINILAYAAAYDALQREFRMTTRGISSHEPIIAQLSEIPRDRSLHNAFAQDQQFFSILQEMQDPHTETTHRSREVFNYEEIFGAQNYRVLSAPSINISDQGIRTLNNEAFVAPEGTEPPSCTHSNQTTDYEGAVWMPAHPRNFGSRGGEPISYITIHTIQGSYASAISWFKNPNARVSAHYVIRASDGQVTQMVCEKDAAYHVRTDNPRAIGIEHEGFIDEGSSWYTTAMYESSARLVRDLCRRWQINPLRAFGGPPTDGLRPLGNKCYHIKGHQHFRGNDHIDPGPFWDWDRYYRLINEDPEPNVYTQKRGEILDPGGEGNYGDQIRTTYLIKPKNTTTIQLNFEEFELEGTTDSPYDYLDIYDGEDENSPFLGRFTGDQVPEPLLAQSGAVFMEFRTDCQINKKGWRLSYTTSKKDADCPVPTALQASNLFPMGATLSWSADRDADHYLLYIKRRNLDQNWQKYRTRLKTVTLTGLSSNALYQWEIQAVCGADTSGRVGDGFITPAVSQKGAPQIYTLSLNSGKFNDSGGEAGGYINNEAYIYRIMPPNGKRIALSFEEFDTEACCDYLIAYDGPNTNARVLDTLAGTRTPRTLVSSGNAMTLLFISDGRTTGTGWRARWRTGNVPEVPDPEDDDLVADNGDDDPPLPNPGGNGSNGSDGPLPDPPTGNAPPFHADPNFDPELTYASTAPKTVPRLEGPYGSDFTLQFDDVDQFGRGLANRFYNLAEYTPLGWRGNDRKGFLYDDFNQGLHPDWKQTQGQWVVQNGRLIQRDQQSGNTNLYTSLEQSRDEVYVYHWRARMTGSSNNKRMGLHFFCSQPEGENRGNSYFVWVRDAADGDKLEIYKTYRNQFYLKVRRDIRLNANQVYDYKVIYNPQKGRIEVYINNDFSGSYNDPSPYTSGKGVSLRTGNSQVEFDDLLVYHARDRAVKLRVGPGSENDVRRESTRPGLPALRVHSLIVDRNIRWSPVGVAEASIQFGGTPVTPPGDAGNTGVDPGNEGPSATGPQQFLEPSYQGNFSFPLPSPNSFYLVADYNGQFWGTNPLTGFLLEEFSTSSLNPMWTPLIGRWRSAQGVLQQLDENATNSNIYLPLNQQPGQVYLYHFRARLLTEGDNKRFGFHFFCSDGSSSNRGDSYMLWFRRKTRGEDKVEIYRNENDQLSLEESAIVRLQTKKWYDIKTVFNHGTGQIDVYLDNAKVLSWRDRNARFPQGRYLSLRTGSSQVQYDDLRVYLQAQSQEVQVSVGGQPTDMVRFKSDGNQPTARVMVIDQSPSGRWSEVKEDATRIE